MDRSISPPRPQAPPRADNFDPVIVPHDDTRDVEVKATEDIRQGERGHHVWQILSLSFAGAALALAAAYFLFFR